MRNVLTIADDDDNVLCLSGKEDGSDQGEDTSLYDLPSPIILQIKPKPSLTKPLKTTQAKLHTKKLQTKSVRSLPRAQSDPFQTNVQQQDCYPKP